MKAKSKSKSYYFKSLTFEAILLKNCILYIQYGTFQVMPVQEMQEMWVLSLGWEDPLE